MEKNPLMDDLDRFLMKLDQQDDQETPLPQEGLPHPATAGEEAERPTLHLYYVDEEELLPPPGPNPLPNEGQAGPASPPPQPTAPETGPVVSPRLISLDRHLLMTFALIAVLGLVGGLVWCWVTLWFAPSATLTLVPERTMITAPLRVTVMAGGTATAAQGQVPGRKLSTLTLSQERTVPTTGMGHQEAQAAHGWVTFYNALPTEQMIPAGTLLVGADGVQVVTEQDAGPTGWVACDQWSSECSSPRHNHGSLRQHRSPRSLRPLLSAGCLCAEPHWLYGWTEC